MATTTRIEIINRAKIRAGRQAQNLNLVNVYDAVIQYMSMKYPLINHQRFSVASVGSQQYLRANASGDTPAGDFTNNASNVLYNSLGPSMLYIRSVEKIQYNAVDTEYLEPELFFTFYSASTGTPTKTTFTWKDLVAAISSGVACSKVWMYPIPVGTSVVQVFCSLISPKSAFSGLGDNHLHGMGEEMDEAIIRGVTWKALEIVGNFQEAVREKIRFEHELKLKAMEKIKGATTVHQPDL